ncbi:MAG TPA: GYD domain-containing protein [Luteibacter sp.]|jgi:uncharacterized protein with GYD domain|nr:GYD domain-containing protein [Luteibacter sp.]
MPFYMHQWTYKDQHIRRMLTEGKDRAEIIRVAIEAFGGQLHSFFYSFGHYDGVAISSFPDQETALACGMAIFGEGRLITVDTTVLIEPDEGVRAMTRAKALFAGPASG